MRVRLLAGITVTIALGAAPSAGAATTRYASPAGGFDCSVPDKPCTLAQADVADGDTIVLAAGDYGSPHITHAVTLTGTGRPTVHVGTLTFDAPAGNSLRDLTVLGDGAQVLKAEGITLERALVADEAGSPTTICALGAVAARDSVCLAHGSAKALTVNGDSQLRNVTAASAGGDAISITGARQVLIHNTISAGVRDLVADNSAADIQVDHTRWTTVSYPLPGNPFTFGDQNTGASLASMWSELGGPPIGGSLTIDAGLHDPADGVTDLLGQPRTAVPDIGAYEYQPSAPVVVTGDASVVGTNNATVTGTIDPRGDATAWVLQWGTTTAYENTATAPGSLMGTLPVAATTELSGLDENTTYHYRYVATNSILTVAGADKTFTTLIHPASPPVPQPEPKPQPKPTAKPKVTIPLPATKRCRATRTLSLKPRIAKGGRITAVSVYVKGKRVKRITGAKARRTIKLSRLPRGRYTLEVRVTTKDGRTVKIRKRYKTCARAG